MKVPPQFPAPQAVLVDIGNKTRHPHMCDGQTGYTVKKLDTMVEQIVKSIFKQIKGHPRDELVEARYSEHIRECKANLSSFRVELKASNAELAEYEAEVINVIRGTSHLNAELLNKLHTDASKRAAEAKANVEKSEVELQLCEQRLADFGREYDSLVTWADVFDESSIETKKMILTHILSAVRVSRDYNLDIDLNVTCEQFGFAAAEEIGIAHVG